jgi:hypothetical protein
MGGFSRVCRDNHNYHPRFTYIFSRGAFIFVNKNIVLPCFSKKHTCPSIQYSTPSVSSAVETRTHGQDNCSLFLNLKKKRQLSTYIHGDMPHVLPQAWKLEHVAG